MLGLGLGGGARTFCQLFCRDPDPAFDLEIHQGINRSQRQIFRSFFMIVFVWILHTNHMQIFYLAISLSPRI